jgi:hypothetical protein
MIDKITSCPSVVEIKNIIYEVNDNIVILVNNIVDTVWHNAANKKYERCLHKIYIYYIFASYIVWICINGTIKYIIKKHLFKIY